VQRRGIGGVVQVCRVVTAQHDDTLTQSERRKRRVLHKVHIPVLKDTERTAAECSVMTASLKPVTWLQTMTWPSRAPDTTVLPSSAKSTAVTSVVWIW
jgi:hypothetical protein